MSEPKLVPVFNCVVNVAPPDDEGTVVATVANLSGLIGRGKSEREALAQVVPQFKSQVARVLEWGQAIPWIEPPTPPKQREVQRLIAVHL